MLTKLFSQLNDNQIISKLNKILTSKWMILVITFLTLLSNAFGLELLVLWTFTFIVVITCLFADDLLSLLTISCCGYFTFSRSNNPLSLEQTSIFLNPNTMIHMYAIAAVVILVAGSRLVFDIILKKKEGAYQGKHLPKLTLGFIVLGVVYILGGLFSEHFGYRTSLFGLFQIVTLGFSYFYFYYTVDFKKVEKDYFGWLFLSIGILLSFETIVMLHEADFFTTTGIFTRDKIFTGWGINNNVAAMLVMMIPIPVYFALERKNTVVYLFLANIIYIATILTQSRNGIVFGAFMLFVSLTYLFIKQNTAGRIKTILFEVTFILLLTLYCIIDIEHIQRLFSSIIAAGLNDSGRFDIYKIGFNQFLELPIFGRGFYASGLYQWGVNSETNFLPPRYHNTIIQLLASCGAVGLIGYLFHRVQTLKIFLKKLNNERFFIGASVVGLLITSILDCHFFNMGPGFIYGALLLLAEIDYIKIQGLE